MIPVCILTADQYSISEQEQYYFHKELSKEDTKTIRVPLTDKKKAPSREIMFQFCEEEVFPRLEHWQTKYVLVTEPSYFKMLTKVKKVEPYIGYVLKGAYTDHWYMYLPSLSSRFYNPSKVQSRIDRTLDALASHVTGNYQTPGTSIISNAVYPSTTEEIKNVLSGLKGYPKLTVDIETFSLKHPDAGLGSITLCWNDHEGTAFLIDPSKDKRNEPVRQLLREFFETYEGSCIYHNASFDIYVLVYQLYMKDLLDTEGLLKGLSVLTKNFDDTKLIAYLATNSCAGNELSLKVLAQEFAGNWAQDSINDITQIPTDELLQYNLVDGLSTWFVYNKYYPRMVKDEQEEVYLSLFKPAVKDIIQMQLTGLPVDMDKVIEAKAFLENDVATWNQVLSDSQIIKDFTQKLNEDWVEQKNKILKKKRVTPDDAKEMFNPQSTNHLRELLYDFMGLPIIEKTNTGLPATDQSTLEKLSMKTVSEDVKSVLQALISRAESQKILNTFIPALEGAYKAKDGWHYLYGNLNLGGTVSGRLSSNNP